MVHDPFRVSITTLVGSDILAGLLEPAIISVIDLESSPSSALKTERDGIQLVERATSPALPSSGIAISRVALPLGFPVPSSPEIKDGSMAVDSEPSILMEAAHALNPGPFFLREVLQPEPVLSRQIDQLPESEALSPMCRFPRRPSPPSPLMESYVANKANHTEVEGD